MKTILIFVQVAICAKFKSWYISPSICIQITILQLNPVSETDILSPNAEKLEMDGEA